MAGEEKLGTCDSCDYEDVLVKEYRHSLAGSSSHTRQGLPDTYNFCEFCAHTMASNATMYPSQYEHKEMFRALGWSHNRLMAEIRGQA